MKLLIVDDEAPARDRLRRLLGEIDDCEIVAEAGNGEEALSCCSEWQPDIVLLDVRMPGLSGIEVARHIDSLEDPPAVIFTTAYDQYAVEAFETEAVGYLLKPVRKEKLAHALRHAARVSPSRVQTAAASGHAPERRRFSLRAVRGW
jgi:two-component system response regulator AlgR